MAKVIVKGVVLGSSDVNPVTKETIVSALGYDPADTDQVNKNTEDIARILTEGVGSGIRCLDCATFLTLYLKDKLVEDVKYEVDCTGEEMADIISKIDSDDYDFSRYNVQFIVDDNGEISESTTSPRFAIRRGKSITVSSKYEVAVISCDFGEIDVTVVDNDGTSTVTIEDGMVISFNGSVTFTSGLEIEVFYPLNNIAYQLLVNAGGGASGSTLTYAQITRIVKPYGIYTDAAIPDEPTEGSGSGEGGGSGGPSGSDDYEGDATDDDILGIFDNYNKS